MKYKMGDIVKIKEGLTPASTYNFERDMIQYCGKAAKVIECLDCSYHLNIDNGEWYWDDHMLESANHKKYEITVEGNTITVKDDRGYTGIAKCSPEDEFDLSTGISIAIDRLRWKPREYEDYWTVALTFESNVMKYTWINDDTDKNLYKKGLIFKTKTEAKKVANAMLKAIER